MIMSTMMLARAIGPKSRAATPGRSGTRRIVSLASSRSYATPATDTSSMLESSSTTAALDSRHAGTRARAGRPPQAVHVDADDARAAERAVGLDADLMAEERAGVDARILQREGEQRGRHLLAGGDQHVALAVVGRPRRLACEREQAIRLARHRRHDDDELVAGGTCGRDDARHVAD